MEEWTFEDKVCIGYTRVSSPDQKENGFGLDRQRDVIEQYIKKSDSEIASYYEDDYTGTKENRPSLLKLFADLKELQTIGEVVVVIEASTRLARELLISEALIKTFIENNVRVFSVSEGIFLTDDTKERKFIRQMMGAISELDKESIIYRLKAGRESKRRKDIENGGSGKVEGRKGYKELCPKIFEETMWLKSQGHKAYYGLHRQKQLGTTRISNILNDMGYETLSGSKFTRDIVRSILRSGGIE